MSIATSPLPPSHAPSPLASPPPPRPALWTAGRGTRGIAIFPPSADSLDHVPLYTATALASGPHTLHPATYDVSEHIVKALRPRPAPDAVYSLCPIRGASVGSGTSSTDDRSKHVLAVGLRRGVSLWKLVDLTDTSSASVAKNDDKGNSEAIHSIGHVQLEAPVVTVLAQDDKGKQDARLLLAMTANYAYVLDVDSQRVVQRVPPRRIDESIVAVDWISEHVALLVASAGPARLLDLRLPDTEPTALSNAPCAVGTRRRARPHAAAVANDGRAVCIGGEGGSVWQVDLRGDGGSGGGEGKEEGQDHPTAGVDHQGQQRGRVVWVERKAHRHWVTAICAAPGTDNNGSVAWATGGTDGVVRCWTSEGRCERTIPLHDDTVTGVTVDASTVTSVSYDGRIAINLLSPTKGKGGW